MDKIPTISQLLKAMIVEDYANAIEIITDKEFNPNETNKTWGAPVLTAIITVVGQLGKITDKDNFKTILKEITKHEAFNPNVVDAEGETVIMHIARHPDFNWLAPFIISNKMFDINKRNFMHKDAIDIAEKAGNTTLADILLPLKGQTVAHMGMPKKIVGIKKDRAKKTAVENLKKSGNELVLDRVEKAFSPDAKKNPVSLYNLLVNFFKGNYKECMQIVKDVNFNPNECDNWDEPALSSLMYYSQDSRVVYDEDEYKKIADAIISLRRFDVNALDADCNTILMVAMGFPRLKWLAEKLFDIQSARLDVINDMGYDIREIAESCGNDEFYNSLVRKSFQPAEVVD